MSRHSETPATRHAQPLSVSKETVKSVCDTCRSNRCQIALPAVDANLQHDSSQIDKRLEHLCAEDRYESRNR